MNGWIKLHKKIFSNEFLRKDHTALVVFIWLLCQADNDGQLSAGRWQISTSLNINPSTIYKALRRLEKAKMVTQKSNNQFTAFQICNWSRYQAVGNSESKNQVKTKEKPSNTLKEYKNKELLSKDNKRVDIDEAINEWEQTLGVKAPSKATMSRYPLKRLIDKHGLTQVLGAIKAVGVAQGERFAPSINHPKDLEDKWLQLKKFWFTKKEERGSIINID